MKNKQESITQVSVKRMLEQVIWVRQYIVSDCIYNNETVCKHRVKWKDSVETEFLIRWYNWCLSSQSKLTLSQYFYCKVSTTEVVHFKLKQCSSNITFQRFLSEYFKIMIIVLLFRSFYSKKCNFYSIKFWSWTHSLMK